MQLDEAPNTWEGDVVVAVGPTYRANFAEQTAAPAPPGPLQRMVPTRGPIFIGIDVQADKLLITLWRNGVCDAMYAPVGRDEALQRSLPQAIDEAIASAQLLKPTDTR